MNTESFVEIDCHIYLPFPAKGFRVVAVRCVENVSNDTPYLRFALPNANAVPYFFIVIFQIDKEKRHCQRQISGKALPPFPKGTGKTLAATGNRVFSPLARHLLNPC
ncbi:hypothetical protein [Spongiibacter tropicus]|uniref:hypothetical protein n=1 Tax=Spongiibacter tropicus TaxID=454602 RepID=UPI003A98D194